MSNDEQRIPIAEACGLKPCPCGRPLCCGSQDMPDYLSDLNAMHEAEATLSEHDQAKYQDVLAFMFVGPEPAYPLFQVIHATAAQRAEAFLKTIGRWKD